MYRLALLLAVAAGCSSEDTCGTLTLALAENAGAYPTEVALSCDLRTGGIWDTQKNDATLVLTDSELPADAYVSAHLLLDMVKPGATLAINIGIAGEAYTKDQTNHANLTGGTVTIIRDVGIDLNANARVFEVSWELEWLGTGTYHSTGHARVWFAANHGL